VTGAVGSVGPGARRERTGPAGGRRLAQLAQLDVGVLTGVGPVRRRALAALGIDTVLDLITHYPFRYLDQTRHAAIGELRVGDAAWVVGEVRSLRTVQPAGRGGRSRVELTIADGSGTAQVTFFNQRYRATQLPVGTRALFFGKLSTFRGRRVLVNPQVDLLGDRAGQIVALYPASERAGITSSEIAALVAEALRRAGPFADPLPEALRRELGLVDRTTAFRHVHRPGSLDDTGPARRRLAFDELLWLQLDVQRRRRVLDGEAVGVRHLVDVPPGRADLLAGFVGTLPFPLTGAQRRAIDAIRRDMGGARPMHRLLQGDVGSGKTVVAAAAALVCVQGGHQAAVLAPTEVLAEQHHRTFRALTAAVTVPDPGALGGQRPLVVELVTGRVPASSRRRVTDGLRTGRVDVVVGTHALLSGDVGFADLGLVVVDEQHRFGVEQRAALRSRVAAAGGAVPDLLVMTATPIPRTAAMAVLGDLDVTELDELPAGRGPVETTWCRSDEDDAVAWERIRAEVAAGRRAYVVCPLVEDSPRTAARAAAAEVERLASGPLAGLELGLLHGQLRPAEKDAVMASFRSGLTPVLVATTVVEVGVDVPEATVMVVEDAGRFGIAQLHQLRGRVGRAHWPSWCYLIDHTDVPEVGERLEALVCSTDGFELAEVDLELRGEGTVFGTRQRGRNDLKLASLRRRHRRLVAEARRVADALLDEDVELTAWPLLAEEVALQVGDPDRPDYSGKG
jgi:ATP-dependent DNA helicase RecG